ncbi:MAG: hypothetical protein IJ656_01085 [Bacilli bacterium]|nr:hypothetical protein [Bacilli bacterium]
MKRFIAYLLLGLSILVSVFVGFVPTFYNVNASADYSGGREFIYSIALKEYDEKGDAINYINGTQSYKDESQLASSVDDVIDEFKSRLSKANVTNVKVERIDNAKDDAQTDKIYSIRVAYKAQYEQLYNVINNYLTFDWNLSIAITKDPFNFSQYVDSDVNNEQLFVKNSAELIATTGELPVIKYELKDPQKFHDDIFAKVTGEESSSDSHANSFNKNVLRADEEESGPSNDDYIYIVNNWSDKYDLTKALTAGGNSYYTDAINNVIYRLDTTNPSSMFYDYDEASETKVFQYLKLDYSKFCPDLSSLTDQAAVQRIVFMCANIEVAKLNSTPYKFNIKLLNESYPTLSSTENGNNTINAFVETLKSKGTLTFSTFIISTIFAFCLVSLFMALNYGIAAVAGVSTGTGITLLSAALISLFGVEFNVGSIVTLIIVAIASIFSSTLFFKKVKENVYMGKQLKKAYIDASKKMIGFHIDVPVVLLAFGLVSYLIPNPITMSIGAILILGAIFNVLTNFLVIRPLYWLLANSSFISEHVGLLNISKKLIPDLSKDEKPTYFDSFKTTEKPTRNSLIKGIVALVLLVGSVLAISLSHAFTGSIYRANVSSSENSQVYITYKVLSSDETKKGMAPNTTLESYVLDNIYTYDNNTKGAKIKYESVKGMYSQKTIDDLGNIQLSFTYIVNLKSQISSNNSFIFEYESISKVGTLNQVIDEAIHSSPDFKIEAADEFTVYLVDVVNESVDTLNKDLLILSLIGVGICTVYVLFRFGLSKALVSLLLVGGSATISVGLFAAIGSGASSVHTLGVLIIFVIAYGVLMYHFGSQREILKDNKNILFGADAAEKKKELLLQSNQLSISSTLVSLAISLILLVSFIISSSFKNQVIILAIIGSALILLLAATFILPLQNLNSFIWTKIKGLFKNMSEKRSNKKDKGNKDNKKQTNRPKDDGPQEAIFIGIND